MVSDGDDRKFLLFKQPALNLISGLLVHRGSPLINDKDRGMADERPGHCHTLTLAAGQEAAVFSNRRVDALAESRQKLADTAVLQGSFQFFLQKTLSQADIGVDIRIKQEHILMNYRDQTVQLRLREIRHGPPVIADLSLETSGISCQKLD